jgi:hypothetical protein
MLLAERFADQRADALVKALVTWPDAAPVDALLRLAKELQSPTDGGRDDPV